MKEFSVGKKITAFTIVLSIFASTLSFAIPAEAQTSISNGGSLSGGVGAIGGVAVGCALNSVTGSIFSSVGGGVKNNSGKQVPVGDSDVAKETGGVNKKESCWDAIGFMAAKQLLKKITVATVTWINTGFKGEPLFLKNRGSFFLSIADEQLTGLVGAIKDGNLYPFGKDIARNIILSHKQQYEQIAQYSLNKVIGTETTVKFQSDFNAGGWDGWLAMTQFPANNQIGANIQAADEVSIRLAGTTESVAEGLKAELQASGGFLDLKKCVEVKEEKCLRYETITPGELTATQLTNVMGSSVRQLELIDELNESLGAVFDALTVQLMNKGLSLLGDPSQASNIGIASGYGDNSNGNPTNGNSVPNDDAWFNENPDFNIWRDLQPLIDLQRKYKNLLDSKYTKANGSTLSYPLTADEIIGKDKNGQNMILPRGTVGENYLILEKVLPAIYELDFCIPGPNPLWKNKAETVVEEFANAIPSSPDDLKGIAKFLHDNSGHSISMGFLYSIVAPSDSEKLDKIIIGIFEKGWGVLTKNDGNLNTQSKGIALAYQIYDEYVKAIDWKYDLLNLPTVAYALQPLYKKVPGYINAAEENQDRIELRESIIRRLEFIRDEVSAIPEPPRGETWQTYLNTTDRKIIETYLRSIGRVAPDLVNENSIETVEDDIYGLNDIYNYVAGDPNSLIEQCKTELTNNPQFANLKEDRFPYPTKLLPKAVQDTYVKWGPYGGYQATQSGYQGHLDFPSYLAGFSYGYASNGGQDPNNQYLPGHSFLYVSGLVNIHVITATADFERSIGIY